MTTLYHMSKNVVRIVRQLLESQNTCKLIHYTAEDNPLAQLDMTNTQQKNLFLTRVFPYPHEKSINEEVVEIRVYYPDCELDEAMVTENTKVVFDIVVHKNLYLVRDTDGEMILRPHLIAQEIVNSFKDSKGTIGRLHFERLITLRFDDNFQGIRLVASMFTIG